jgi:hypothetical protein
LRKSLSAGQIGNGTGSQVDLDHISLFDIVHGLRTFQQGQSGVDGVAEKDTCKALGYNTRDTGCLDG